PPQFENPDPARSNLNRNLRVSEIAQAVLQLGNQMIPQQTLVKSDI
ncbi:MAG: hypothetical protein RI931_327, partial [Actinomycetota bacterium]